MSVDEAIRRIDNPTGTIGGFIPPAPSATGFAATAGRLALTELAPRESIAPQFRGGRAPRHRVRTSSLGKILDMKVRLCGLIK